MGGYRVSCAIFEEEANEEPGSVKEYRDNEAHKDNEEKASSRGSIAHDYNKPKDCRICNTEGRR